MSPATGGAGTEHRRPDASMTLLTSMLERPLDPGYAAEADRREAAGLSRSSGLRSPLLFLVTILIGAMLAVAAAALRADSTTKVQARARLIEQIDTRQKRISAQEKAVQRLRTQITAGDAAALRSVDSARAEQLHLLALASGDVAVRGPGFVVTLDDGADRGAGSADGDPRTSSEGNNRVYARDLQIVTNSLWESGAEAIAINGQRLTSKSAIRFAGEAILVDFRPLARPYVITAVGDPGHLPATFADGSGGTYLATLKSSFGIRVSTVVRQTVTVPATASLTTRYARPVDTGGGAGSPAGATPTSGGSP